MISNFIIWTLIKMASITINRSARIMVVFTWDSVVDILTSFLVVRLCIGMMNNKDYMRTAWIIVLCCLVGSIAALKPTADIQLFPNTESSPSLYLIEFTIEKALPSLSYLLIGMDWYTSAVLPYNCALVNTSISIRCTNFKTPTFTLTASTTSFQKFNGILNTSKIVAVQLGSNLLPGTTYSLQLHLYNVVPNIEMISPSVEMYTVSTDGLVYEQNPNMGAVINAKPNTHLLTVSILNSLSANAPGQSSTLRAEVTIGQAVSTSLSTFMFTMQYPFSFSIGSIPTTTESSSYSTSPIALYSAPAISSYQVLTPNIFLLVFNEQFVVGRKFIVQINQLNNPFQIAATNISIYSLNYNTLTPLEAFEMLYPIATTSFPLTVTMGLPYDAPFQDAMQYYKYTQNYMQFSIQIPYTVPAGYSLRLQLTNPTAYFYVGTAYINIQSSTYTPTYDYSVSQYTLIISNMGPIVVGTTLKVIALVYINTNTLFNLKVYIDTPTLINAFTASSYLYAGFKDGSGIAYDNFFNSFWDSTFGTSWRLQSSTSFTNGRYFNIRVYQSIGNTATSSGSYIRFYLPPIVQVSTSFNANTDCTIQSVAGSCLVTIVPTSTYLQVTVKGSPTYLSGTPNAFNFQTTVDVRLYNFVFPLASTNKIVYPIYLTLYKSDIVNPTEYKRAYFFSADPSESNPTGLSISYLNNYYTSTAANFQTYPGALRFASTTPASMNLVVQPDEKLVLTLYARYGFRSLGVLNEGSYPCTSNIGLSCQYLQGRPYSSTNTEHICWYDRIVVTFSSTAYSTTAFQLLVPDMQTVRQDNYFWYHLGVYNTISKDYSYLYAGKFTRTWSLWDTSLYASTSFTADIVGKAGSYKLNTSINVYNIYVNTGGTGFIFLCTQWSLFENGVTSLSAATTALATPVTFTPTGDTTPLGVYLANGMYLTVIPFKYTASVTSFTFWMDNAHMPYTYDLPNMYLYTIRYTDLYLVSSNSYIMANGGTLYESPLQSLVVTCQDNAVGVVSTYCTIVFGTSNPLLANGNIRLTLSGMTVATSTCFLYRSNGTAIPVTCSSSTDNLNLTVVMTGWEFYPAGSYTLVVYGIGINSQSLSQSITLYLYESTLQYSIQTGVRILMTTIASLNSISLTQIMYSYLNPLSYGTMTINFYLPRPLYTDQEFAFVIGQDLSDVNTEVSRIRIQITRQDGTILQPLYYIDNVNYLIVFTFATSSDLIQANYTMTIAGLCTPVSQKNAFNMIYRRKYDFAYTMVNNYQNVIFPVFVPLVTSDISLVSYFNTEGYKQDLVFTIVNTNDNVDEKMVWVFNFPSYYSSHLFQKDAYCTINGTPLTCTVDSVTPYQLKLSASPVTVIAGTPYELALVGMASPRRIYTNSAYPQRYIFIGVLVSSTSTYYVERALLSPEQSIQEKVAGVVNFLDMVGVSAGSLFAFSSLYGQFQMKCNINIPAGSYLFLDMPQEFNNLNNIPINAILLFGANTISSNTVVLNKRIQLLVSTLIPLNTMFQVQFPNLPTPISPCSTEMSEMIITVTPSDKKTLLAASQIQGNSAPRLTFQANSLYLSFNYNQPITITAGTYSQLIPITTSNNASFLSNINIQLQSSGFVFEPASVFLPIGQSKGSFRIGADGSLVPVVYFYQAVKQEEVNTNYQITLNMNIQVTNAHVPITVPTTLTLPRGGCTDPFLFQLPYPPFRDLTISYVFDNTIYSETDLYPNSLLTPSEITFGPNSSNGTFSFCSSSTLAIGSIPLQLYLSGTNYNSYSFSPSDTITLNVVAAAAHPTPTLTLALNNQQKTFLDVNFTNNVKGTIFYQMSLGDNPTQETLQNLQVYTKNGQWVVASQSDFMQRLYTVDRDNRIVQFFQSASTQTIQIDNLVQESPYKLCAYLIDIYSVASAPACLQLSTMTWGTVLKAKVKFTKGLNTQELNNVLCFFTKAAGTSQLYLVDGEGNSCSNRAATNSYYNYAGHSFTTQTTGTNLYLLTNPTLTGSDPAPLAFTNLFSGGVLSATALTSAQSMFSITYLSATYQASFNARTMTDSSQSASLQVFYSTPSFNSAINQLMVNQVQIVGGTGTVYFLLVFYKQIVVDTASGQTTVNIRMNKAPTVEQVLNCQNWLGQTAQGCGRAVYTGMSPLNVAFAGVRSSCMYLLYYVVASEFPLRPVVGSTVYVDTVVTFNWQHHLFAWVSLLTLLLFL